MDLTFRRTSNIQFRGTSHQYTPQFAAKKQKAGPEATLETDRVEINGANLTSPYRTNKLTFQGTGKSKKALDNKADAARAQQEEDTAFLEERARWFQENRPGEEEVVGGYVTTPGASDDEEDHPFSARRKAKKSGRAFNEYTQKFETK